MQTEDAVGGTKRTGASSSKRAGRDDRLRWSGIDLMDTTVTRLTVRRWAWDCFGTDTLYASFSKVAHVPRVASLCASASRMGELGRGGGIKVSAVGGAD